MVTINQKDQVFMMDHSISELDLSGVEETALLTLYAKAIESRSPNPVLKDEKIEKIASRMDTLLAAQGNPIARQLRGRAIDPRLTIHLPLRSRKYDQYALDFLRKYPEGVIINIGCGLDTRFYRIDNGKTRFFDLDLPEMIHLKGQLLEESDRYRMIGVSVLDHEWIGQVEGIKQPALVLAEGVFMYLAKEDVRNLVLAIQRRLPGAELVCELTNRIWVEGLLGKIASMKLKRRIQTGGDIAFKFGVSDARELERWGDGIEFVEKWFYMDDNHPKLGWMRIFRHWKLFREAQFTARYRLLRA